MKSVHGREEVDYCVLVPNPSTSWIVSLLFHKAAATGWGTIKLARFLNDHPDIPEDLKPFQPESVGYWLDHEIYYGELVWEKNSTGIVDDARVVEPNAPEDMLRVPEYCEPLVSRELWLQANRIRQARRERIMDARARKAETPQKQIMAAAPGMTLKYLLSGLVYCSECGLRMTASSSGTYTTKSGEAKRYVSYVCPAYLAGHCSNSAHVSEDWLRSVVVEKIRERLFPASP
jgi:hypothetical protein